MSIHWMHLPNVSAFYEQSLKSEKMVNRDNDMLQNKIKWQSPVVIVKKNMEVTGLLSIIDN